MVSYSNTGYENDFFDVSDVYFNSTSQSSGSAVDLDELDARYLQKTGGTVSSNLIVSGSVDIKTALTLPIIGDVEDAIQGKQNELTAGTNITVEGDEVSCDLTAGTNIDITSGVISSVDLATTDDLDTKQDTISNFEINGNVNLNTTGTNFDTIVVRRPSNTTGLTDDYLIDLNELQIWVNDTNILVQNTSSLVSSVVSWSNKDIDLGSQLSPTNLYNGLIENGDGVLTLDPSPTDIAIIIKNIPTSKINDIHAVQIYNNTSSTLGNRVIGLAIELYNSKNDPDLNTILAQSNEILVRDSVYRFDFPSITTYNLPFNIQGILPNTGAYANLVILEVITPFSFPFNVIGNIDVNGSLILPTIGDVETTIQGKQNELTTGANITIEGDEISCDLTAGTNINITSGVISTTGLQNELTTGANITIDGNEISCDLTAGTNIDITDGVISTTGLQNELTTGANITIEGDEISCDLTAGTNINITSGVISTTGLQNELTTGANITIEGDEISCDLTAGTNINITDGVISTTGLQNELTTGANITIEGDEISCDLTAGTNIDITSGVISTTGLQNELTTGANISIDGDEISCDLTAGTNIRITDGVISSIVGETDGTGVDDTTDLNVNTITSVGNINV